jgi:hypothetical protein
MSQELYYDPGKYRVQVTEQGMVEAQTGTIQFMLKFTVLESIEPPNDALEQFTRRAYWSLTPKTTGWVLHDLRDYLNCTAKTTRELDPDSPVFYDFRGKEIELTCAHEPSFENSKVLRERWGVRGERKLTNKSRLDELDAELLLKPPKGQKTNVAAVVTLPPAVKDGVTEDDVPF